MFKIYHQPYTRGRYPTVAANGVVATGNNLAAAAGLQIMREGGNALMPRLRQPQHLLLLSLQQTVSVPVPSPLCGTRMPCTV